MGGTISVGGTGSGGSHVDPGVSVARHVASAAAQEVLLVWAAAGGAATTAARRTTAATATRRHMVPSTRGVPAATWLDDAAAGGDRVVTRQSETAWGKGRDGQSRQRSQRRDGARTLLEHWGGGAS